MIPVSCNVVTIDGFSGHSDRKQLMDYYVRALNPTRDVSYVTMGIHRPVMHSDKD